jgi:cytochrome oxidase assembly protein ShyY1
MLDEMEYEKVTLNGRFDHSREFLIYPRARFDEAISTRGRNKEQSNYGAHVITPLHVANCGSHFASSSMQ